MLKCLKIVESLPRTFSSKERESMESIEQLSGTNSEPLLISLIAQFFLSPYLYKKDVMTIIPVSGENDFVRISQEIGVHFNRILHTKYSGSKKNTLSYRQIKSDSLKKMREIYEREQLHPVVSSLYFNSGAISPLGEKVIYYKVQPELVQELSTSESEFDDVWKFLKGSYGNKISLFPNIWVVNDELQNNIAFRYFSHMSGEFYIVADEVGNVRGIDIHFI